MIKTTLNLLKQELDQYIGTEDTAVIGNIAMIDSDGGDELKNKIVISLVNVEEESTYKNVKTFVKNDATGKVTYQNPPIYLNLYILFCAHFKASPEGYNNALSRLSQIIRFFQSKNTFNRNNSSGSATLDPDFKLTLDLYTLTFEQVNHLWGSLGGKQLPSVLYKARLIIEQDVRPLRSGTLIEEIQSSENII